MFIPWVIIIILFLVFAGKYQKWKFEIRHYKALVTLTELGNEHQFLEKQKELQEVFNMLNNEYPADWAKEVDGGDLENIYLMIENLRIGSANVDRKIIAERVDTLHEEVHEAFESFSSFDDIDSF